VLLVGAAGLLGACGGVTDLGRAETRSSGVTERTSDTASRTTTTSTVAEPTSTSSPPLKVLKTVETEITRGVGEQTQIKVRLDVLSLERLPGDLVELQFRITNLDDARTVKPFETMGQGARYDLRGAAILDLIGSRRYEAVLDTSGRCLCTSISFGTSLEVHKSATYYARFGAPPASTKQVDLELPGFLPVRAIPIS